MLKVATAARSDESRNRERPILFSAPMVRALLAGRKTQTRRTIKPQPPAEAVDAGILRTGNPRDDGLWWWLDSKDLLDASIVGQEFRCPYGVPGDRLWVREAWRLHERFSDVARIRYQASERQSWTEQHEDFPAHLASVLREKPGYRPSIHMPRWASRITLNITDVRVERLQEISEADADAECFGGDYPENVLPELFPRRDGGWGHLSLPECYARLWNHINGPASWDANPWVWAVSFEVTR